MTYYVHVGMGLGGNISLSQYATAVKKQDPTVEIGVMSPYNDIFEATPAVDYVYTPNQAREFIFDAKEKQAKIITSRLYDLNDFIYKRMNYAQAWDALFGHILYDGTHTEDTPSPLTTTLDVVHTFPQIAQQVDSIIQDIKNKGYEDFVIVQLTGGQTPLVQVPISTRKKEDGTEEQFPDWSKVPYNNKQEPLQRHYPEDKAAAFITLFQQAHPKTAIVLYQLPNEPYYDGCLKYVVPYLAYYELAQQARGVIAIDSSLQHLVSGVAKTIVLWGHTLPTHFGYEHNHNIIQECRRDDILYFNLLGPASNKIKYITPQALLEAVDAYIFSEDTDEDTTHTTDAD